MMIVNISDDVLCYVTGFYFEKIECVYNFMLVCKRFRSLLVREGLSVCENVKFPMRRIPPISSLPFVRNVEIRSWKLDDKSILEHEKFHTKVIPLFPNLKRLTICSPHISMETKRIIGLEQLVSFAFFNVKCKDPLKVFKNVFTSFPNLKNLKIRNHPWGYSHFPDSELEELSCCKPLPPLEKIDFHPMTCLRSLPTRFFVWIFKNIPTINTFDMEQLNEKNAFEKLPICENMKYFQSGHQFNGRENNELCLFEEKFPCLEKLKIESIQEFVNYDEKLKHHEQPNLHMKHIITFQSGYDTKSFVALLNHYPNLESFIDESALQYEWLYGDKINWSHYDEDVLKNMKVHTKLKRLEIRHGPWKKTGIPILRLKLPNVEDKNFVYEPNDKIS